MLNRRLISSTVRRVFLIIRAIINLSIHEYGLECKNAFAKTYIPDLEDSIQRISIPLETIKIIQQECMKINDPNRWLIALLSDTGMRLSEALGLKMEDIKLNEEIPHVNIIPNSARKLKTKSSTRQIPLVGIMGCKSNLNECKKCIHFSSILIKNIVIRILQVLH